MMRTTWALAVVMAGVAVLAGAVACSKDEAASTAGAEPSATASAVAMTTTTASAASAAAVPPATTDTAPSATASATTTAAASASATGTKKGDAGLAKGAATCGDKPLPPCPLYAWMKANTSAAMTAQDFDALAVALEKTAKFAPPGYPNWVSISRDGADAARAQSLDGVKGACRGCHNQYKDKYKKEMRDRPI